MFIENTDLGTHLFSRSLVSIIFRPFRPGTVDSSLALVLLQQHCSPAAGVGIYYSLACVPARDVLTKYEQFYEVAQLSSGRAVTSPQQVQSGGRSVAGYW